jgi:hypothetical protein
MHRYLVVLAFIPFGGAFVSGAALAKSQEPSTAFRVQAPQPVAWHWRIQAGDTDAVPASEGQPVRIASAGRL